MAKQYICKNREWQMSERELSKALGFKVYTDGDDIVDAATDMTLYECYKASITLDEVKRAIMKRI